MTLADWLSAAGLGCCFLGVLVVLFGVVRSLWSDDERVRAAVVALIGLGLLLGVLSAWSKHWPAVLR